LVVEGDRTIVVVVEEVVDGGTGTVVDVVVGATVVVEDRVGTVVDEVVTEVELVVLSAAETVELAEAELSSA
jgi:hypothetical protein